MNYKIFDIIAKISSYLLTKIASILNVDFIIFWDYEKPIPLVKGGLRLAGRASSNHLQRITFFSLKTIKDRKAIDKDTLNKIEQILYI